MILAIQVLLSIAFLVLLARRVPLQESWRAIRGVQPLTVVLATALTLVGFAGRAARWRSLLAHAGVSVRPLEAYRLTLLGVGYGLVTPGRVGEFARATHLAGSRPGRAASVLWDRFADVLLLEAMSLPAFLVVPAWRGPLLAVYVAMVVVTAVVVLLADHPDVAARLATALPPLRRALGAWHERGARTLGSPAFLRAIAGGIFYYVFSYAAAWLVLADLVRPTPVRMALAFPLIPLIGNLPVAFGGLGLREQVSATVFGGFGVSAAAGPAWSLVCFATSTLLPGLIGIGWRALGAFGPRPAAPEGDPR